MINISQEKFKSLCKEFWFITKIMTGASMAILPDMEISYNGYTQSVRAIQVKQMDIFNLNYVCNSPRFFYVIGKDTIMPFSGCSPIQAIDKNNYPEYIVEVASIDGKKADIEIIRVKKDVLDSEIKYKGEFDQRG